MYVELKVNFLFYLHAVE